MSQPIWIEPIPFPSQPRSKDVFHRNTVAPHHLVGGPSTQDLIAFIKGEPGPTTVHEERVAELQRELDELRDSVSRIEEREFEFTERLEWLEDWSDAADLEVTSIGERLDRAERPDEVAALLAELISHCERIDSPAPLRRETRIAQWLLRTRLRFALLPAFVTGALTISLGLSSMLAFGNVGLDLVLPWLALLGAVPLGLTASTLFVRLLFTITAPIQPAESFWIGPLNGTVTRVSWCGIHLAIKGRGERFVPYYLALCYPIERQANPATPS